MLTIRLARRGRKKFAFFDLVVAEKTRAVQKKFIAKLGYLNPHTNKGEGEFVFDAEAVTKYIKNGAQLSQRVARELVKAGIKDAEKFIKVRPTKPKKETPKKEAENTEEVPTKTSTEPDEASSTEDSNKKQ